MTRSGDGSTLVIGATSELGIAISNHLASRGKRLIVTGRSEAKLKALISSMEGQGHETYRVDYMEGTSLKEKLSLTCKLDGIVLITPRPSPNSESLPDSEEWRELFEKGFIGPMEVLRQAAPCLSRNARVVIISGITSIQYYPALPQFAVLRNMWLAEAKALSVELGQQGVSVNTLSLGGIWTDRLARKLEKEAETTGKTLDKLRSDRVQNVPLGKYAEINEVTQVVEQMLGALASHISGQNVAMDGGFVTAY